MALVGTGLLTVALALLAFQIGRGDAGIIMGTAMTIKMVAYVLVSPLANAVVSRFPQKRVLIVANLVRAAVALALPFVTEAWQIYLLIFFLQFASATFTPTFQAVIPAVLPAEREYTKALSLSRLAYDLEALVSPMLAAALLTVISFNGLFVGTVLGFVCSAGLVLWASVPRVDAQRQAPFLDCLTEGVREFWRQRELRGLLGLNLVVATTTAMVIVNTVVLVQGELGRDASDVALLFATYGAGSMLVALIIPRLLDSVSDRSTMLVGAAALPLTLAAAVAVLEFFAALVQWPLLHGLWAVLGAQTSAALTPLARVLRRNSTEKNMSAVFAAQFSLSHACYLLTYPLTGLAGASLGLAPVGFVLALLGGLGVLFAFIAWPRTAQFAVVAAEVD